MAKKKRIKNVFGDDIGSLSSLSKRDQRILKKRMRRGKIIIE